jgi:quercetin dioxygenase-like cupin family protein
MSELTRLNQRPEDRFAAPVHHVDLEESAGRISAIHASSSAGHKHETLYKHGPVTVALFVFESGAGLLEHTAGGVVTVQVLQGRLKMTAEGKAHELSGGQMLVIAPGVRHDVYAQEPTRMLLTVCLVAK